MSTDDEASANEVLALASRLGVKGFTGRSSGVTRSEVDTSDDGRDIKRMARAVGLRGFRADGEDSADSKPALDWEAERIVGIAQAVNLAGFAAAPADQRFAKLEESSQNDVAKAIPAKPLHVGQRKAIAAPVIAGRTGCLPPDKGNYALFFVPHSCPSSLANLESAIGGAIAPTCNGSPAWSSRAYASGETRAFAVSVEDQRRLAKAAPAIAAFGLSFAIAPIAQGDFANHGSASKFPATLSAATVTALSSLRA